MVCDVCTNVFVLDLNSTTDDNSIVECTQCKIKVHQLCYGVQSFSDNWLCDFCIVNSADQEKKCELCPTTGGAMKPTTSKKWVHVICSLFTPQVIVQDPVTMQPINLKNIPKRAFKLKCYVCEKKGNSNPSGACVNCSATKCKRNLHVSCGQSTGTLKEKKCSKGDLLFIVYCEDHVDLMAPRISFNSVETVLIRRIKLNEQQKASIKNAEWIASSKRPVSFICIAYKVNIIFFYRFHCESKKCSLF
jgi:hypothetical protein